MSKKEQYPDNAATLRPTTVGLIDPNSTLRRNMQKYRQDLADATHKRVAAQSAEEARNRYRIVKAVEGKTVRPYQKHDLAPFQFGETHETHRKRTRKERARSYRGVTAETVRTWTDLSLMTEEERANHIKAGNRERKKRFLEKKKHAPVTALDPEMENALEDFDWPPQPQKKLKSANT